MKKRIILIILFSLLAMVGAFLRFANSDALNLFFIPGTGRELWRYVYANSLMLGGICLLLFVLIEPHIKRQWSEWLSSRRVLWALLAVAFICMRALYLTQSWSLAGALGYPIDDAWIHAVYARNLANSMVLGFLPGIPDSGCSAPLWPLILAPGSRLGIGAVWNGYCWANIFWAASLWPLYLLSRKLLPDFHRAWLILLVVTVQPMLIWSSLSGLETGLFVLLVYGALFLYSGSERMKWMGALLAGLGGVVRAEGWILIGAIFLVEIFRRKASFGNALGRLGLSILIVLPWVVHNYVTIGNILPQTFYAKSSPFSLAKVATTAGETATFALSPGMWAWTLLLPVAVWGWIKRREGFSLVLPVIIAFVLYWCAVARSVGFFWTYYRYLHPFMPFLILFTMVGVFRLFEDSLKHGEWIVRGAITITITAGVFGSTIYGYGVENIEHQQVAMAVWMRDNVPEGETVAANDVGAMGYFSEHRIFDLIGLVGENVRLRNATWQDLLQRGIHWAVIYPDWFPFLSSDAMAVPVTEFRLSRLTTAGRDRVVVLHNEK